MKNNKSGLAIGGCTLIVIGFIFVRTKGLYFLAAVLGGIGLGFLLSAFLPTDKENLSF